MTSFDLIDQRFAALLETLEEAEAFRRLRSDGLAQFAKTLLELRDLTMDLAAHAIDIAAHGRLEGLLGAEPADLSCPDE